MGGGEAGCIRLRTKSGLARMVVHTYTLREMQGSRVRTGGLYGRSLCQRFAKNDIVRGVCCYIGSESTVL